MARDVRNSGGHLVDDEGELTQVVSHEKLAGAFLAYKTWDGSEYVWPNGGEPDPAAYVNILFAGPDDPATATGGRDVAADIWVDTGP